MIVHRVVSFLFSRVILPNGAMHVPHSLWTLCDLLAPLSDKRFTMLFNYIPRVPSLATVLLF